MDNIMKMSITKFLALIAMFLWGSQSMAGSVTVPNVFVGGSPALASDVNANFSAIKTEVDDNDARINSNATAITDNTANISSNAIAVTGNAVNISNNMTTITDNTANVSINMGVITNNATNISSNADAIVSIKNQLPIVVVDGNGQEIGDLISFGENVDVFTQKGYVLKGLSLATGSVSNGGGFFYENTDCSGAVYLLGVANGTVFSVLNSNNTTGLYYIEKNSLAVNLVFNSYRGYGSPGCTTTTDTMLAWPTIINDPVVTGVSNSTYTLPITLQRAQ